MDRMEVQSLAVVIPKVNPDYCEEIRKFSFQYLSFGIVRDYRIKDSPNDRGMLEPLNWMNSGLYEGCVRRDQPSNYILIPLAYRTRLTVGKQEAPWHNIKARRLKPQVPKARDTYFLP